MMRLKQILTALTCIAPIPSAIKCRILSLMGHNVSYKNVKIKPSIIICNNLYIQEGVCIGFLNYIKVHRLIMRKNSYIQNLNLIKGPLSVLLKTHAAIGNFNQIKSFWFTGGGRTSSFTLGVHTKVTSFHYIVVFAMYVLAIIHYLQAPEVRFGRMAMFMRNQAWSE